MPGRGVSRGIHEIPFGQTNRIFSDVEDGLLSRRQHLLGEPEKILEIFANLLVIAGKAIVAHVEF